MPKILPRVKHTEIIHRIAKIIDANDAKVRRNIVRVLSCDWSRDIAHWWIVGERWIEGIDWVSVHAERIDVDVRDDIRVGYESCRRRWNRLILRRVDACMARRRRSVVGRPGKRRAHCDKIIQSG